MLCLLYFAQGFPWGFATIALLAFLSEAGHSKERTATIVTLAILPWTFKFLWAPVIDTFRLPAMGLRRPWIALAQLGMGVTLLGVWSTGEFSQDTTLDSIAMVFFFHNCFASLQDVATDALAVDLLDDSERGRVNGLMWGSKLLGISAGGAGLGTVIAHSGVETALLLQSTAIFLILLLVLRFPERTGEKRLPWSKGSVQTTSSVRSGDILAVARELIRAFSTPTTALAALVASLVLIAEGLYTPLTTDVFVKKFGWTAEAFSQRQGTFGVLGEVIGALAGGFLCDRFGRRRMAGCGLLLVSATLLTFGLTSSYWEHEAYPRLLLLPAFKGSMAFTTVCFFSLYMKISWTSAAASQFTIYMALNNVGYTIGNQLNKINSWFRWSLSDANFYVLGGVVALVPIVGLLFLRPDTIAERKIAETPVSTDAPAG